jgi:sulfite reductase (NADPH) hemoprotein beta-component
VTTTPPSTSRASYADRAEIDAFVDMLGRFERGEIDAEQWRAYRVLRGAYGQRQEGVHMLRIKLPQGLADAVQLRALAEVAERYSRGFGHVTTRQNFQVHFVRPADLEPAMRRLAEVGITTHGAGGNAVRNVVACALAGVAADEVFDVTPYAEAVTRHFLRHPLASSLPRKFKVAFEGCPADHVATPIHDLGFRARLRVENGREERGFSVSVAGGTSSLCTTGHRLFDFLPAADVLALAEAVVRVMIAQTPGVLPRVQEIRVDAVAALVAAAAGVTPNLAAKLLR